MLAGIRDYNCSPDWRSSRHDNASASREPNDSAISNKTKGGRHVDNLSRRRRSKRKKTDRDSTSTEWRRHNNDSNAIISNLKDSRLRNRPTSSATEAEVSRTVTVPVQESRNTE